MNILASMALKKKALFSRKKNSIAKKKLSNFHVGEVGNFLPNLWHTKGVFALTCLLLLWQQEMIYRSHWVSFSKGGKAIILEWTMRDQL